MWGPAPRQMAEPIRPLTCAVGVHQALAPVLDVASEAPPGPRPRNLQQRPVPVVVAPSLAYVRGLQIDDATTGVAAPTKHFVGYSASEGGLKPQIPLPLGLALQVALTSAGRSGRIDDSSCTAT
jgi:beta-glucosidase-like glycosyl hydrolase